MFVKDLESLKYAELRKLAKGAGIKANQKVDKLMKALKEHYIETDDNQENCTNNVSTTKESDSEFEASSKAQSSKLISVIDTAETTASHCATKNSTKAPSTPLSAKKTNLKGMSTPSDEAVNISGRKLIRKRRRTFELAEPTLSPMSTPTLEDHSETRTPETNTPLVTLQAEPAKKRVRKNTYNTDSPPQASSNSDGSSEQETSSDSSPGTRAMIEEMDINLSSVERKDRLLAALEKKIKTKAGASPAQNSASQPSQIPRFMAFLVNKKNESQKPLTPGSKNWTKIHNKEFSKFDSLDVYLEKKQQRIGKLTGSASRSTTTTTGPSLRQGRKIAKPVSRLQVPVNKFVPSVTSTKNISFNFSKTPVTLNTKTPSKQKSTDVPSTLSVSQTPRARGSIASTRKPAVTGSKATPFIFTGNSNTMNTTVTTSKKTFDLKASLAKPLSWKPHTGKLDPVNKLQSTSTAASQPVKQKLERPSRQTMASKTRPVGAKDVRRTKQLDRRNNQKYIDMMKRRGLLA